MRYLRASDIFGRKFVSRVESPWELTLTEPVPEVVEFRPADWPEKYFSGQPARSSSRVTLSPSYTKQFSLSIDLVAWPVKRGNCRGKFQKKIFSEAEEITRLNMGLGTNTIPSIFSADLSKIYRKFL